jgi:hypothetical protein
MTDVREDEIVSRVLELLRDAGLELPGPAPRAVADTGRVADVVDGEIIESAWGNAIRNRTTTPFLTSADRDASIPPPDGGLCYLLDSQRIYAYSGGEWIATSTPNLGSVALAGTIPNSVSPITIGTLAVTAAAYARLLLVFAQITVSTAATAVWELKVTSSAAATTHFQRGRDNGSSTSLILPVVLPADTATTLTATAAFTTAPGNTGTIVSGGSRMDYAGWPQ